MNKQTKKKSENVSLLLQEQKQSFLHPKPGKKLNSYAYLLQLFRSPLLFFITKLYIPSQKEKKLLGPFYFLTKQLQFHLRLTYILNGSLRLLSS